MELADYLRVLRRRWWLIALITLICAGGAAATTFSKAPRYTTTTRLLVSGGQGADAGDEIARRTLAAQRAVAFAQLVDTGPADAAAAQASNTAGAGAEVTASAGIESPFITITVAANSAQAAQRLANAYVTVLPDVVRRLEQTPSSAPPQISTLEAAPLPTSPTTPIHERDIMVGLTLGLVLGIAGALVRETLDARVRESSEIEKLTGAMLLGSVPKENGGDVLVAATRPRSGRAESYRHIRTNLEFTGEGGMPRSIVVTSPAPSEGKSSLSANLSIVAARSGRRVVLVDADLRKPSVAKYFGLKKGIGLTEVLSGRTAWQQAMVQVDGENIHILPSGALPKFPSELVGSARMAQLIMELEDHYDLVIIDTPPVLPVSDALIMGVNAGGVVMVARMQETRRASIKRAVEAIEKVDGNLLGVVANAVVRREEKGYGEGYGYAYGYNNKSKSKDRGDIGPAELAPATRRGNGKHSSPVDKAQAQAALAHRQAQVNGAQANGHAQSNGHAHANGNARSNGHTQAWAPTQANGPAQSNGQVQAHGQTQSNGEQSNGQARFKGPGQSNGSQVNGTQSNGTHANGASGAGDAPDRSWYAPPNGTESTQAPQDSDTWLQVPAARSERMRPRRRAQAESRGEPLGPTTQPQPVLHLPDEKPAVIEPDRLDDLFRRPAR